MKRMFILAATIFAIAFAFGNIAWAQGHHHGGDHNNWPDSLETIDVTGTVIVDSSFSHELYYLDTNGNGQADYHLSFGPWWYEPTSGATRPNAGETVTITGAVMDGMMAPPVLVVFTINGLEWREPIEFGGHGWNGHGMWENHGEGDTLTVTGTVLIDTTYFYPHYYLDVDNDSLPDYQLGFGPPWYEPQSGATRPYEGDAITVFGFVHDDGMMGYDMLVVITIDGLEWRPLAGPAPWAGTWMHRGHQGTARAYCVNDSSNWIDFPPGHMGGGMMGGWPDSMFVQFWRIHPDSLPGQHFPGHFAGFYIDIQDPSGHSMMGRQMGWGRGHMRFERNHQFRFQYRDEEVQGMGMDENGMAVHVWNEGLQQWQEVPGAMINSQTNTVTLDSQDLSNYYALFAPATVTGIADNATGITPAQFVLEQNYPNPFNPSTAISFQIPEQVQVKLEIFNMLGQRVRTLVNDIRPAGTYTVRWDGRDEARHNVTSGIYLLRLEAGDHVMLRRMTLMK